MALGLNCIRLKLKRAGTTITILLVSWFLSVIVYALKYYSNLETVKVKPRFSGLDSATAIPLGAALAKLADTFQIIISLVNGRGFQIGSHILTADTEFCHRLAGLFMVLLARDAEAMDIVSRQGHIFIS